jgi:hypothetical protein
MKTYGGIEITIYGMEVLLHAFLTSTLDGGEMSASHTPGRLTIGERSPGANWTGG